MYLWSHHTVHLCSLGKILALRCALRGRDSKSVLSFRSPLRERQKQKVQLVCPRAGSSSVWFCSANAAVQDGGVKPFPRVVGHQTFTTLCPLSPDYLSKSRLGTGLQGCWSSSDEVQALSLATEVLWSLQKVGTRLIHTCSLGSSSQHPVLLQPGLPVTPSSHPASSLTLHRGVEVLPWQDRGCKRKIPFDQTLVREEEEVAWGENGANISPDPALVTVTSSTRALLRTSRRKGSAKEYRAGLSGLTSFLLHTSLGKYVTWMQGILHLSQGAGLYWISF